MEGVKPNDNVASEGEVLKTNKKRNIAPKFKQYLEKGGPGRPKGMLNKFTQIKKDMLSVWVEENGKERFRGLFHGTTKDFLKALSLLVDIMPKQSLIDIDATVGPKVVIVREVERETMKRIIDEEKEES